MEWEQTAARVVKPPPKVKTTEQIAAAAASQARIDALVADFDPNDPAYGPADTGLTVTGGGRYGTARDEHLY